MERYLVPLCVVAAFVGSRWLLGTRIRGKIAGLQGPGAAVRDVRYPRDFASGHGTCGVDVPLAYPVNAAVFAYRGLGLAVCCAPRTREAVANGIRRRRGVAKIIDGGSQGNVAKGRGPSRRRLRTRRCSTTPRPVADSAHWGAPR